MLTTLWEVKPRTPDGLRWIPDDRRAAHRMLMSGLPTTDLDATSPREEACMTWWYDSDNNSMAVRLRSDLQLRFRDLEARRVEDPAERLGTSSVDIQLDVARQYTPMVQVDPEVVEFLAARGKTPPRVSGALTPVGPERLHQWATDKLARLDVQIEDLHASPLPDARLNRRRRERVPAARVSARVAGSPHLTRALHSGVGKAKNYGLGMVRISPATAMS